MLRNYQYRIYPTKSQTQTFEQSLDACRTLYNQALHWRKTAYESNQEDCREKEGVSYGTQASGLTELRKQSQYFTFSLSAPDGLPNPSGHGLDLSIQAERGTTRIVKY